jgi:hypothetical protein
MQSESKKVNRKYEQLYGCDHRLNLYCMYYLVKVKVKFSLCLTKHHAMKTYWGSRGIAPHIRDVGTWKLHAQADLRPGKETRVPIR